MGNCCSGVCLENSITTVSLKKVSEEHQDLAPILSDRSPATKPTAMMGFQPANASVLCRNLAEEKMIKRQNCADEMAEQLIDTIRNLEESKGRPVYFIEIWQSMKQPDSIEFEVFELFKDDRVLADLEMNLFSLNQSLQRTEANQT